MSRNTALARVALAAMAMTLFAPPPARGAFTGLSYIPTADVKGPMQMYVAVSTYATSGRKAHLNANSQLGLNPYFEIGYDHSLENSDGFLNVKARYPLPGGGAVAGGVWNVAGGFDRKYYLACSTDLEQTAPVRLHTGVMDPFEARPTPFLGLSATLTGVPVIGVYYSTLEWIGGDVDLVGIGGSFNVGDPDTYLMLNGLYGHGGKPMYYINLGRYIQF